MGREVGAQIRAWNPPRTRVVELPPGAPIIAQPAKVAGNLRLVYSGRLEEKAKRISELARAVISVLQRHRNAQARFIGDGSKREAIQREFQDAGLLDRVEFTGFVDPDQVQEVMSWGNVLVLLSDFEGVPGAVMDGMACGLVPVCLDIPGGLARIGHRSDHGTAC